MVRARACPCSHYPPLALRSLWCTSKVRSDNGCFRQLETSTSFSVGSRPHASLLVVVDGDGIPFYGTPAGGLETVREAKASTLRMVVLGETPRPLKGALPTIQENEDRREEAEVAV